MKSELLSLASALDEDANYDKRLLDYFIETAEMLPSGMPNYQLLFQLVMRESLLHEQLEFIEQQWPDFLATRYANLCNQLTNYLDRFAPRRQFERDVLEGELENVDLDELNTDISQFSNYLRSKEATKVIDKSIPDTLDSIGKNIETVHGNQLPKETETKISADKAESANNIFKTLFENVVDIDEVEELIKGGNKAYKEGFKDNYVKESYNVGAEDSKNIAKVAHRAMLAEGASRSIFKTLPEKYPKIFGWMNRFK